MDKSTISSEQPAVLRYIVAAMAALAALGVRMALDPVLGPNAPYVPFLLAILAASRYGGRGPGLAAAAISTLAVDWFFIEPRGSIIIGEDPRALAGLALFFLVGVLISLLVGRLRATLLSAARAEPAPPQVEESAVSSRRSTVLRYAVAAMAALAALGIRMVLNPVLGPNAPYLPFTLAILLASRYGGRGPGLAAAAISTVAADWFFIEPHGSLALARGPAEAGLALFFLSGVLISLFVGRLRQSLLSPGSAVAGRGTGGRRLKPHHLWFGAAIAILAIEAGLFLTTFGRFSEREQLSIHTREVLAKIESLLSDVKDAEIGQRGYLVTGEDQYLPLYNSALQAVPGQLDELRGLTLDNPRQQARIESLQPLIAARLALLREGVEARRTRGTAAAVQVMATGHGRQMMDQIRQVLGAMRAEELSLLERRSRLAADAARGMSFVMLSGAGLLLIVLLGGARDIDRNLTRRQRAEEALRESEGRLQFATTAAGIGVWSWTPGTSDVIVSGDWRRLFGIPQDVPVTFETWRNSLHPEDREAAASELNLAAEQHRGFDVEYRVVWPDGAVRWLADRGRASYDDNGRAIGMAGVNVDITSLKRAEEKLRVSEEKFAKAFATNPAAVAITRFGDGLFLDVNQAWEAMNGWGRDEVIGRSATDFPIWPTPGDRARFATELREKGSIRGYEQTFLRRSGEPFTALLSAVILNMAGEEVVLSTLLDVTARKQAEENLRISEEKFARTFAINPSALAIARLEDGLLIDVNETWQAMMGYSRGEAVGRSIQDLHSWAEPELRTRYVRELREKGSLGGWEVPLRRRSGELFTALMSSVILPVAGEDVALSAWLDISGRKKVEFERETAAEFLQMVNASASIDDLIRSATAFVQAKSGCQAVGIRLKEGEDYPYYETRGFPEEFVRMENSLCTTDATGEVIRNSAGYPVLECMCGNVLCGRFDPAKPFFSEGGSFWTNNTTQLLGSTAEADRQGRTRNRCNGQGYESVALIPVRAGGEGLGLLQLNDRRTGMFSPETIALWERLAEYLAAGLTKIRAQEALRQSEERLRLAQQAGGVGTFEWNVQTGVNTWSPELERLYGLPPGGFARTQPAWESLVHPEDRAEALARVEEAFDTGRPGGAEWRVIWPDGSIHWLSGQWQVLRDDSGAPLRLTGANVEITERKKAEEALRESETQFRTLANAIPTLCWMANADGWIFWYNERWYQYTGTTPEQMEGWGWQSVHDPEALPKVLERWGVSLAEGLPFDMVFPLRGADGVFRPFLTRIMPVRDRDGKIARWFGTNTDISAQVHAEAEVRKTRDLLELFIKSAPVALAMFDRNMRYIRHSDQWLGDTGAGDRRILGLSHYEVFPDMPEHWKEAHQRGLAGESLSAEEDWVALDGKTHTIRWEVHPWGDSGTETGGIIIGFEDITERKQAEEALRESERRYRGLFESMQEAFFLGELIFDAEGKPADWRYLDANPCFETVYGRKREEVVGRTYREVFQGPWSEYWIAMAGKVVLTGEPEHFESYSNTGRYLEGAVYRPRPGQFAATVTDATTRHEAQEALRQSEAKFRNLFESMDEGFASCEMIYDAAGQPVDLRYLDVNPAFGRVTGLPAERVTGRTVREVIPEIEPFWIETYGRIVRTGTSERIDNPVAALGKHFELFAWCTGPGRFAVVFNDVTERKRAEAEIRRLNAELEDRVRRRTAQLEASNKELEAFAYSVSHDLRAPLRGIDGWSLALVEDYASQLDERAHGYVDRVRSETQRMGLLIDDLLQLSRIARSEMQTDAVDLTSIARTIAARLAEANPERRIEFIIGAGIEAKGDARLLEIALTNLLGNAVKFTGPRAEARIEFGAAERAGEHAFYVRDNGVGFDMAFAGALFGAFQRLHKTTEFPGTGIGLATVQRIIRRHGGRVWAESEPDAGATFYFTLGGS